MTIDFGKIMDEFVAAGKDMTDKMTEVSNKTRIKIDIKNKEDFLEKQFAGLGKAFYENEPDFETAKEDYFKNINNTKSEIAALEEELKQLEGSVVCPQCGLRQNSEHKFCANCGAKLPVVEKTAPEGNTFCNEDSAEGGNYNPFQSEDKFKEDDVVDTEFVNPSETTSAESKEAASDGESTVNLTKE